MGKRHFKGANASEEKRRRKDNAEKWKSVRGDENNRNPWVLENARFEAFYKAQKFMKTDADWDSFMKHLQSPLPACFRIWSDYTFADELRNQMLEFAGKTLDLDGVEIKAAEQLKWYPGGYGYKLGTDRRSIRKLEGLSDLKKWMLQHTENGNITRQEAVSMVPPLALNVSPQHRCLDMCAAPGSKTSQLLEIVNRSLGDDESQQGLVVANDADTDRAYMLVHQCRRINSPLLVVSTHKGQHFPSIYSRNEGVENATKTPFFDRVLCDVPCSGDGTLRKNPAIWAKWSTSGGMTLHPLQLMIAQRGLQLLKEEGLLVYSTCSMSPYENEAVVAELLRNAGGGLELVDARQFLPLFNCRPGLTTWHVLDDFYAVKREARQRRDRAKAKTSDADAAAGETEVKAEENQEADEEGEENAEGSAEQRKPQDFSHIEDAELRACLEMGMTLYPDFASVPSHMDRKVRKSFFPPTEEEKQWMNLERCLRCVPQDEDTGGFFVATLRKIARPVAEEKVAATTATAPATNAEEECDEAACEAAAAADMGGDEEGAGKPQRSNGAGQQKANRGLVDFHQWDEETFQRIKEFYGFKDSLTCDAFFIREDNTAAASSGAKSIYFIPASVRALMHGDADARLKVVTAGVKVFEKKVLRSGDVDYRLLQDGISYLEPYITKRKISVTIQDFCNMLGGGLVSYTTLSAECISRLSAMPTGVVIATYEFNPEDVTSEAAQKKNAHVVAGAHKFQAICWKGGSRAINVMCGKIDIESIKHQLAALGVLRPKIGAARPVDALLVDATESVPKTAESEVKTEEVSVENAAMECEQPGA